MRPVTAPPPRAICNARLKLVRAAAAVRMFDRMETHMPVCPEIAEQAAPIRKLITTLFAYGAVNGDKRYPIKRIMARTTAIIAIVPYCLFIKASAPWRMALEIRCIYGEPESEPSTERAKPKAASRPTTPTTSETHR